MTVPSHPEKTRLPTYDEAVSEASEPIRREDNVNESDETQRPFLVHPGLTVPVMASPQSVSQPIFAVGTGQRIEYSVSDGVVFVPVRQPVRMFCPYDHQIVTTRVHRRAGCQAFCASTLLCCFCWPCFWMPFCVKSCLDVEHACPLCHETLAIVPA